MAFRLRELLQSMSLDAIVKTSGKTGLHVFVPIRRTLDFVKPSFSQGAYRFLNKPFKRPAPRSAIERYLHWHWNGYRRERGVS